MAPPKKKFKANKHTLFFRSLQEQIVIRLVRCAYHPPCAGATYCRRLKRWIRLMSVFFIARCGPLANPCAPPDTLIFDTPWSLLCLARRAFFECHPFKINSNLATTPWTMTSHEPIATPPWTISPTPLWHDTIYDPINNEIITKKWITILIKKWTRNLMKTLMLFCITLFLSCRVLCELRLWNYIISSIQVQKKIFDS